ncbi:MAG: glycosyltransferase [Bacteroides sp.]
MEALALNSAEIILLSALGGLWIIQLIYYFTCYNRIGKNQTEEIKNKKRFSSEQPPLSVVVYARNDAENLRRFLPTVLQQDYPLFEVIVINDASTDDTEIVLEQLQREYPHLYYSFTPDSARYISHKKLALTLGIKASKYNWLVFTETNCEPASPQWLSLLARNFTPGTEVVLGAALYKPTKGFRSRYLSFDTLFTAMRYLGLAHAGKPYMGIGRNLAYRKELFFAQKGYSSHLNLQRGEDDIFINRIATGQNTRIETDSRSVIRIEPLHSIKSWIGEKISYKVTGQYYKGHQRQWLGFETTSRLLFHTLNLFTIVWSILQSAWIVTGVAAFLWLIRYITQLLVVNRSAKVLGEPKRFYTSLLVFDFIQPLQSLRFELDRRFHRKSDFQRR